MTHNSSCKKVLEAFHRHGARHGTNTTVRFCVLYTMKPSTLDVERIMQPLNQSISLFVRSPPHKICTEKNDIADLYNFADKKISDLFQCTRRFYNEKMLI